MPAGPARPTVRTSLRLGIWLVGLAGAAPGDGTPPTKGVIPAKAQSAAPLPATRPADPKRPPSPAVGPGLALPEPSQARAEVEARLKELAAVGEKDQSPAQKALKGIWEDRQARLKEWDDVTKARQAAENPRPSPEEELAKRKDELERARAYVAETNKSPDLLLTDVFRLRADQVTEAKLGEMREAIEGIKQGVKDREEAASKLRDPSAGKPEQLKQLRTRRDRLHAKLTTFPAIRAEREAALAGAKDEDARRVARERLVNFNWEHAIEAERLRETEATLSLEARRSASAEIELQTSEIVVGAFQAKEKALTDRYKAISEQYQAALHTRAAVEEKIAAESGDPLEKYKARRMAERHRLEAEIADDEKSLLSNPDISLEEQTGLANRAEQDFGNLKKEVKENRIGGLLALRLNNDFRRIIRERAVLLGKELPKSNAATTAYENKLTEVELSYFGDDHFERDALVEGLSPGRQAAASAVADKLDDEHRSLLARRRDLLDRLLQRAEETHNQVDRRLRILDEHYAFIRTSIFWVRDSEPIGPESAGLIRGDAARVAKALIRLAAEPFDRSRWSHASVEFGVGAFGVVALPWVIVRMRRALKGMSA